MARNVDAMFRAFADFTRLRILHLLAQEELSVGEIMAAIGEPQTKVSRHLGYLRLTGLAEDRREGRLKFYSLAEPTTRFQARIFGCLKDCREDVGVLRRDLRRLRAVLRKRKTHEASPQHRFSRSPNRRANMTPGAATISRSAGSVRHPPARSSPVRL